MRKHQVADEAQGLVLDAKYEQFRWARGALEQARFELGGVIASVGLSASARRIGRSRQWCLQVVEAAAKRQEREKEREREDERDTEKAREGRRRPFAQPEVGDLIQSIRRSGFLEPLVVEVLNAEDLRVVDGQRRIQAAIEAGVSSLPVNLVLRVPAVPSSEDQLAKWLQLAEQSEGPDGAPVRASAASPFREPIQEEPRTENVEIAEAAAHNHRRVRFLYARQDGEKLVRTVDAWGLVYRTGSWYLVGHDLDRQAKRTFRISRIIGQFEDLGEGSKPPPDFSAGAHVWGKLDPDFVEVLEEAFRNVLNEERSQAAELESPDVGSADTEMHESLESMLDAFGANEPSPSPLHSDDDALRQRQMEFIRHCFLAARLPAQPAHDGSE